jgi:3-methyladenine DNA glycosylase/8-oxoguanine DNA glycosylase
VPLVPVVGPVDLAGSLDVFRRSGDDLLDRWDGRVWLRALAVDGRMVGVAARPGGTVTAPALEVEAEAGADAATAGRLLAAAFVNAPEALATLTAADPVVARIAARFPGVVPVLQPDLLTAVVRSISAQQITLRFAAVLRGRLARRYGHRHQIPAGAPAGAVDTRGRPTPESATLPHRGAEPGAGSLQAAQATEPGAGSPRAAPSARSPRAAPSARSLRPSPTRGAPTAAPAPGDPPDPGDPLRPVDSSTAEVWSLDPHRLAQARVGDLRELQFSTSKATAVIAFARAVDAGELDLEVLAGLDDEAVIARLTAFAGIGRWTAEWLLARTLGRPRVVAGDLGVRKAVGAAYLEGRMPSEAEVRAATAHWGAAAGVAQQLLLHWLSLEAPGRGGARRPLTSRTATRPRRSSRRG